MFQDLKREGRLTMRVNYLTRIFDFTSVDKVRALIASWNIKPDEGDEWLRIGGMKTLVDGGFEALTVDDQRSALHEDLAPGFVDERSADDAGSRPRRLLEQAVVVEHVGCRVRQEPFVESRVILDVEGRSGFVGEGGAEARRDVPAEA